MVEHREGGLENAAYVLAAALFISALMVSASVYFSVGGLASVLEAKNFQVTVQGGSGGSAAPTPTPTPAPTPAPTQPAPGGKVTLPSSMLASSPVKGPASAKVTMVEFSDFQCPFCARALPIIKSVMDKYPNDVKLVYKHFPLSSIHPYAQKAAEASECAKDQSKFWEMHDWMFANQGSLDTPSLKAAAKTLGMTEATFNACLDGGSKAAIVSKDAQDGSSLGVSGTPTFYINGVQVVGADPQGIPAAVEAAIAG